MCQCVMSMCHTYVSEYVNHLYKVNTSEQVSHRMVDRGRGPGRGKTGGAR